MPLIHLRRASTRHLTSRRIARLTIIALTVFAAAGLTATAAQAARPPTRVSDRNATVSHVGLQGSAARNFAIVMSGTDVMVTGRYRSNDTSTAIDQIQIGWENSSAPMACIYSGVGPHSGTFSVDLGPAPAGPVNEVIINFAQEYSCDTSNWFGSNQGPRIAEVITAPPQSGSSGPVTLSNVKIVGSSDNTLVQSGKKSGRDVTITGSYSVANTDGAITQAELGFEGTSGPVGCAFSVVGPASGTFTLDLGPVAFKGANFIVVDYSQNYYCDTSNGWWGGTSIPPQTARVGVVYYPYPAP